MAAVNFVTRTPLTNILSHKEISTSTCSSSFPQIPQNSLSSSSVVLPSLQSSKRNSGISARLSSNVSLELANNDNLNFPIMVNGCTGKMGRAVIEAAVKAGIRVIPISFGGEEDVVEVGGTNFHVHAPAQREEVLASVFDAHPNVIVIDYTVPAAVNANAEVYCRVGVPFVMGTTGGDRERLHKTVDDAKIYAVISPQMGKQVVAFLAAMETMADKCPGAFLGYSLQVMESHQASKLDISGTAKAVISSFQKLGVSFDMNQIQKIRDPEQQVQLVGVPEEYLNGHAFHMYHLSSPDETVSFEFQHNVCGRSIYAEGTIDAAIFLAKKVRSKADKHIYNMIEHAMMKRVLTTKFCHVILSIVKVNFNILMIN